jgi:hypothetical protein
MKEKELNKWQVIWRWSMDYRRMDSWYSLVFGIAKYHAIPEQGEMIMRGKHFKGQIFEMRIWLPIIFSRF